MDEKEKQYIEYFMTYLSVEKNFSEHTLSAYKSDLVSYVLWLNETGCINVDFNKLREYLYFIQKFDYKKTTVARKVAAIRTFYKFLFREGYMDSDPAISLSAPKRPKSLTCSHFRNPRQTSDKVFSVHFHLYNSNRIF